MAVPDAGMGTRRKSGGRDGLCRGWTSEVRARGLEKRDMEEVSRRNYKRIWKRRSGDAEEVCREGIGSGGHDETERSGISGGHGHAGGSARVSGIQPA